MPIVLAVLLAVSMCVSTASCQRPRSQPTSGRVPQIVPDSVPRMYYDRSNHIRAADGTYLRDIIVVAFKNGTTQEQREAAIDLVGGTVVGGKRISARLGYYVVRVPANGSADRLWELVDLVAQLPQTAYASVEYVEMLVSPI